MFPVSYTDLFLSYCFTIVSKYLNESISIQIQSRYRNCTVFQLRNGA